MANVFITRQVKDFIKELNKKQTTYVLMLEKS